MPLRDLRVTASDEDSGNNGIFRYSITHGKPKQVINKGTNLTTAPCKFAKIRIFGNRFLFL